MATITPPPPAPTRSSMHLKTPSLPRWAPLLVAAIAIAASGMIGLLLGSGFVGIAVMAAVLYLVGLPLWSRLVEDRRRAKDRMMTGLVWTAFVLALIPLVTLIWKVVVEGLPQINAEFLTYSMRN